ncbi:unnamed protein product [marine sediment metagenome]|uniref:Aldehyde ferredoxin oxidoreductase C-terminal domain-containing protein n=1 Tax=marine sediment metagenome TaxID=412755 RepID=X1UF85_9ZZZZ
MFTVPRNKSIWYGTYEEGTTKEEGTFVDPDIFNTTFLDHWYSLMGWTNDGVPTRSKLEELGMKDVADKLGV